MASLGSTDDVRFKDLTEQLKLNSEIQWKSFPKKSVLYKRAEGWRRVNFSSYDWGQDTEF